MDNHQMKREIEKAINTSNQKLLYVLRSHSIDRKTSILYLNNLNINI